MLPTFDPVDGRVHTVDRAESMELRQRLLASILGLMGTLLTQEDGQLLERGEYAGRVVIACRIAVFVIGTVSPIMALVLYGPVSAIG